MIVRQCFGPSDNQVGIIALLNQERFHNKVGNIVSGNETDLAVLRRSDNLIVYFDALEVDGEIVFYAKGE